MTTNTNSKSNFFNSAFDFSGYINRVRLVEPKKGNPYYSASLCVLSGSVEDPNKMYVDVNIVGQDAIDLISQNMELLNSKTSAFGRFRVADLSLSTYENKKGDIVPIAKGRLTLVSYLKFGEFEYKRSTNVDSEQANNAKTDAEPQANNPAPATVNHVDAKPSENSQPVENSSNGLTDSEQTTLARLQVLADNGLLSASEQAVFNRLQAKAA